MLPSYERLGGAKPLFSIPFGKIALVAVSLPLGAFIFCISWSLVFDFERATFTHCDVRNFLPSISSAIGNYEPQKTIWRLAVLLHIPVRFTVIKMYLQYYQENIRRNRRIIAKIACLTNFMEDVALIGLSIWTSADNYDMHRNLFVIFVVCSEIYMLTSLFLNKYGRKLALLPIEEKSLKYKRNLFLTNITAFLLAVYCFMRHNDRCEPGVYTLFALFEYVVVLTNMGYHMTAYWDFYALNLTFDWAQGIYLTQF